MNTVTFAVGDTEGTSSGKQVAFQFDVNLNKAQLVEAYKAGCRVCKFDLTLKCQGVSNSKMPRDLMGFIDSNETLNSMANGSSEMTPELWVVAYLEIAKLGNPNLTYHETSPEYLNIGGAGLFSFE